nr:MAG TPA_asm: hypothetical protein [Caudoviricetes sp.]
MAQDRAKFLSFVSGLFNKLTENEAFVTDASFFV